MKSHQIGCLGNCHLELDISKNIETIIRGGFSPPRNRPFEVENSQLNSKNAWNLKFSWLSFPHDFIEVLWISTNGEATRMNLRHPKNQITWKSWRGKRSFLVGGGQQILFSRSEIPLDAELGKFRASGNITSSFLVYSQTLASKTVDSTRVTVVLA